MYAQKRMKKGKKAPQEEINGPPSSARGKESNSMSKEFEKIYDKDDEYQENKFQQLNRHVNKKGMAHKIGDVLERAQVQVCEVPMIQKLYPDTKVYPSPLLDRDVE